MALTEKEQRFCAEYAADPNATQAYRRAFRGCTYHTARVEGPKLLAKPAIAEEIEAAREEYRRRTNIKAVRVLRELAAVAFADVGDAFDPDPAGGPLVARPLHDIPPATRRAMQSVKVTRRRLRSSSDSEVYEVEQVEYKFASKLDALDKLCKHLGLTSDGAALEELIRQLGQDGQASGPSVPAVGPGSGVSPAAGPG